MPQRRIRQHVLFVLFLFFCATLSAQSDRRSTFHVSGTVTRLGSPMKGNPIVRIDPAGHYEADLPLGVWKVAVTDSSTSRIEQHPRLSHPRVFRVTKSIDLVIDLYVNAVGCGGVHIVTQDGRPPTAEEEEHKNESCQGREFFPLPSNDGVPFEVVIGGRAHQLCSFQRENRAACDREFGTYNLLTVYADKVTFIPFPQGGLLEGKGNVVVVDAGREFHRTSIRFLINDGEAVEAY
jgi:hypothetical protein